MVRRTAPLVILACVCIALFFVVYASFDGDGDDSRLAGSIDDRESVIVCRDGAIEQLIVPDLESRLLFGDLDCSSVFRWQLDADFKQLLTVRPVDGGRHVFVTSLDGTTFDLSSHMGFASSADATVDHWSPRFDHLGRVFLLNGESLLLADPESGAFETLMLPQEIDRATWLERRQCAGEYALPRISTDLVNLCPWGWYEQSVNTALSFYAVDPSTSTDGGALVAVVADPPSGYELSLQGDLGPCAGPQSAVYWVASSLLCVSGGIGLVDLDLLSGTFSVRTVLEPGEQRPLNVVVNSTRTWVYFTTDSLEAEGGRVLWRTPATAGDEPERLGLITGLDETGRHVPFTLFGGQ